MVDERCRCDDGIGESHSGLLPKPYRPLNHRGIEGVYREALEQYIQRAFLLRL